MSDAAVSTVDSEESVPRPKETWRRLIQGDLASLRVVIGLALIWAIFQFENDRFLSAQNLTNLLLQITAIGLISVGIVFVLLLGEIDLSVGAVSGLAAAVMAVLNVKHGWNPYLSIAAAIAVGMAIGVLQGSLFSRFAVPSFVVTLAGLLAWQGALLQVLGSTGSINLTDPKITGLANTFYSNTVGWIFAAIVVAGYGAVLFLGHRRRLAAGLESESLARLGLRFGLVAVVTIVATAILNSNRGVPLAVLILLAFVVGMEYVVKRTGFGRHVFAVGGNAEAARRAGIRVNGVRIAVFGIAGTMAAIGGIMAASRLLAVTRTPAATNCCCWRSPAR
jgi:D-xylose transport system permease protein